MSLGLIILLALVATLVGGILGYYLAIPLLFLLSLFVVLFFVFVWRSELKASKDPQQIHGGGKFGGMLIGVGITALSGWMLAIIWCTAAYMRKDELQQLLLTMWTTIKPFVLR